MEYIASAALIALATALSGCQVKTESLGCEVRGPQNAMPQAVKELRLGMSRAQLEERLGEAAYSPIEGQLYFATGGDCPLDDSERYAPCGVVADFRDYESRDESVVTDALQSCWWGAIGE